MSGHHLGEEQETEQQEDCLELEDRFRNFKYEKKIARNQDLAEMATKIDRNTQKALLEIWR